MSSPSASSELFVGVLSGTSMDGIDAALVRFGAKPELVAKHTREFPATLRAELRSLATPGDNEIDRLGQADVRVGREFAAAVNELLAKAGVKLEDVRAVGSHGQTIRHRPSLAAPFTLQIGDPNVIAAETGLPVIADFRRKDLALGGQGAPLVPAFHEAIFRQAGVDRVVVNIGGIANLTVLPGDAARPVVGFDTGPGNTLLDLWCSRAISKPMDVDGALAASGHVLPDLLQALLTEPFFKKAAPKSTGPEQFSLAWLNNYLRGRRASDADIQATLLALTARTIADAVVESFSVSANGGPSGPARPEVFVCGGGARNPVLMRAIADFLPGVRVDKTDALGVDSGWVEAMAFAWLARQHVLGLPGNVPAVTGASRAAVLGGVWLPG